MKKRLKLEVTAEHIKEAEEFRRWEIGPYQCNCPIARALTYKSGDETPGFAAHGVLVFDDQPYKVSRSVRWYMDDFDKGEKVSPRTFWLTPL